ncbi:hypothetical protein [Rhodospira trueperi]|uniref:Phage regulatory protein CII (CP76) n=1 Tax=Rhodospira trueperi TaxID=69960 RepID=A0A1G7D5I2_9PROT|nr:hypothetical protein [Rhodospira trueperi]SDE45985.1 hypothetical protein SAMN05421720_10715 [Rhodospira trueperi]
MNRQHDDHVYKALKAAFRRLVGQNGGYCAAADLTRVGKSQLQEYASPHHMDVFPPADVIIDLERDAADPIVTRQMIRLLADADTPEPAWDGDSDDVAAVLHMATRGQVALGELARCAVQAAEDGDLSDEELAALIQRAETRMHVAQSDYDALMKLRETRRGQPHRRRAAQSGRSPR